MNPVEFKAIRADLKLTAVSLGRVIGVDGRSIRRYEADKKLTTHIKIPIAIARVMRLFNLDPGLVDIFKGLGG